MALSRILPVPIGPQQTSIFRSNLEEALESLLRVDVALANEFAFEDIIIIIIIIIYFFLFAPASTKPAS